MFTNAKIEQITLLVATERTDRMSAADYIADALIHNSSFDDFTLLQMNEPEEFVLVKKETTKE